MLERFPSPYLAEAGTFAFFIELYQLTEIFANRGVPAVFDSVFDELVKFRRH